MKGVPWPVVVLGMLIVVALAEMSRPRLLGPPIFEGITTVIGVLLLILAYFLVEAADEHRSAGNASGTSQPSDRSIGLEFDVDDILEWFEDPGVAGTNGPEDDDGNRSLRLAAIETMVRCEDMTRAEATASLEEGTWTDDPYAVAACSPDRDDLPLGPRLLELAVPQLVATRRRRHAVDAIASLAGVEVPRRALRERVNTWRTGFLGTDGVAADPPSDGEEEEEEDSHTDHDATPPVSNATTMRTGHWFGIEVVALVGLGFGLVLGEPSVLLAGVVGVGYAAYAKAFGLGPVRLRFRREIRPTQPDPGDDVSVTVTVENAGPVPVYDLRLVDGLPAGLKVATGSHRYAGPLRPGARASFSFTIAACRGRHEFEPPTALARDLPGTVERTIHPEPVEGIDDQVVCRPALGPRVRPVPLRRRGGGAVGSIGSDDGGTGIDFHATRAYRRGDPMNRIDWNRFARTGRLSTLEFREERAATVVIAVDAMPTAYLGAPADGANPVDRAVEAAGRAFATLLEEGLHVGITSMGPHECWLPPRAGRTQRLRGLDLLGTHPALRSVPDAFPTDPTEWRRRLHRRVPAGAQVVLCTPLCDPTAVDILTRFEAGAHPVTVISPDPTTVGTPGDRLARVRRLLHLQAIRGRGIPVVDWAPHQSLDAAMARDGGQSG